MSCHNIGEGLDTVTEKIYNLYENEKISIDAARDLLRVTQKAVHYCDGNEYEAVEFLTYNNICSSCLKQFDKIFDLYDGLEYGESSKLSEIEDCRYVNTYMCKDCCAEMIKLLNKDEKENQEILNKIIK